MNSPLPHHALLKFVHYCETSNLQKKKNPNHLRVKYILEMLQLDFQSVNSATKRMNVSNEDIVEGWKKLFLYSCGYDNSCGR